MTKEDLKKYSNAEPFRPFRLYLADGNSHSVTHPDAIAVASRTAVIVIPGDSSENDTLAEVAIRHITKIEWEEPALTGE